MPRFTRGMIGRMKFRGQKGRGTRPAAVRPAVARRGIFNRIKAAAAKRQDAVKILVAKKQDEKLEIKKVNRAKFLSWVKSRHPKIYRMALLRAGSRSGRLSGLGQETESWWSKMATGIQEMIPAALQYRQQKDIMKMQLQRAQAGLPPANVADYTPVLKIETELAPETRAAFIDQLGKPVIFGALALGAFLLLKK